MVFLPGAFGLVLGAVVGVLFGTSSRRVVSLLVAGVVLAAASFGFVWLISPASADEAGTSCSDCGQWLGRYWEGGVLLYLLAFDLVGWWLGVLTGAALRRRIRPGRTRPA